MLDVRSQFIEVERLAHRATATAVAFLPSLPAVAGEQFRSWAFDVCCLLRFEIPSLPKLRHRNLAALPSMSRAPRAPFLRS